MNEMVKKVPVAACHDQVVGRFAPSPTGDLHMGSLLAAVASFLAARTMAGRWLVRIEDVDQQREVSGAADRILFDLERFGFEWDGAILKQSVRLAAYQAALDRLIKAGYAYPCACSRRKVQAAGLVGVDGYRYDGRCRWGVPAGVVAKAWRLRMPDQQVVYLDGIQGWQGQNLQEDVGDFVLLRADGFWAYQLAVVVDDAAQGITQVVRGGDLLDSTPRQIWLQRLLSYREPQYLHIPVIANEYGEKLSKQTRARALKVGDEALQLWTALYLLWQAPPAELRAESLRVIWAWAMANWNINLIPGKKSVSVAVSPNDEYKFLEMKK